jgi:hypothetical protein
MLNWFKLNRTALIRNSFLLPILLVVIMSISHVVSWYDLGNPISWAIYLSIAIEIFALASISAASIKTSKVAIWFLFGIVTTIQIIGNIFYGFKDIDIEGDGFQSWVLLIEPFFLDWDAMDHRRFLAIIQGGTLPIMSLTALHFYIQFKEKHESSANPVDDYFQARNKKINDIVNSNSKKTDFQQKTDEVWEKVNELKKEGELTKPSKEEIENEPTALSNSQYRQQAEQEYWEELYQKLNEDDKEKEEQRNLLSQMMKDDEKSELYDTGNLLNKPNTKEKTNDNTQSSYEYINKKVKDRRIGKSSLRPPKNWG